MFISLIDHNCRYGSSLMNFELTVANVLNSNYQLVVAVKDRSPHESNRTNIDVQGFHSQKDMCTRHNQHSICTTTSEVQHIVPDMLCCQDRRDILSSRVRTVFTHVRIAAFSTIFTTDFMNCFPFASLNNSQVIWRFSNRIIVGRASSMSYKPRSKR